MISANDFLGEQYRLRANLSLPDDIRECCEVLRGTAEFVWPWGMLEELEAAAWQILDHLGVL